MVEKDDLRKLMKIKRQEICENNKENMDTSIYSNIVNSENYIKANSIFIYVSYEKEVSTYKIIENALLNGKEVFVPKVISKVKGMKAVQIKSFKDLKPGAYGILEPDNINTEASVDYFDLVILPGLAFDKYGGRLGYGGGFYDRFISKADKNNILLGLAYEFQIVEEVPMVEFDVRIQGIITENKIITVS